MSEPSPTDDKRLERLFDYTKWHIGIYLSVAGALTTLLGSAQSWPSLKCVFRPVPLLLSVVCLLVAGLAGGVVASGATLVQRFDHLWNRPRKLYGLRTFAGSTWACIEHTAFWLSIVFIVLSVLGNRAVWSWIGSSNACDGVVPAGK